jgi:hypothetical protein
MQTPVASFLKSMNRMAPGGVLAILFALHAVSAAGQPLLDSSPLSPLEQGKSGLQRRQTEFTGRACNTVCTRYKMRLVRSPRLPLFPARPPF